MYDKEGEASPAIGQLILHGVLRQAKMPACAVELPAAT